MGASNTGLLPLRAPRTGQHSSMVSLRLACVSGDTSSALFLWKHDICINEGSGDSGDEG